jgi:hypothetical protein
MSRWTDCHSSKASASPSAPPEAAPTFQRVLAFQLVQNALIISVSSGAGKRRTLEKGDIMTSKKKPAEEKTMKVILHELKPADQKTQAILDDLHPFVRKPPRDSHTWVNKGGNWNEDWDKPF